MTDEHVVNIVLSRDDATHILAHILGSGMACDRIRDTIRLALDGAHPLVDVMDLAKAAYAAYMKHSLRVPIPWTDLPQVERDAWVRIAQGVLDCIP